MFFFRVDLEGTSSDYIHVKANVIIKELRLLAEDGSLSIDCVRFGSTYYGTDVIQKCFLYNASPKKTSYVIVLEEHGGGQEIVCDQIQHFKRQPHKMVNYTNCLSVFEHFVGVGASKVNFRTSKRHG